MASTSLLVYPYLRSPKLQIAAAASAPLSDQNAVCVSSLSPHRERVYECGTARMKLKQPDPKHGGGPCSAVSLSSNNPTVAMRRLQTQTVRRTLRLACSIRAHLHALIASLRGPSPSICLSLDNEAFEVLSRMLSCKITSCLLAPSIYLLNIMNLLYYYYYS
jgi:hypothetical protein